MPGAEQYTVRVLAQRQVSVKGDGAMGGTVQYLHAGFILISIANLIVIALLIVVFVLAVTLRRPEKSHISTIEATPDTAGIVGEEAANTEVSP
jgi:uncharacterized membrane protein